MSEAVGADRPTRELPLRQLVQLSIYWFGLTSIWAGLDTVILPRRLPDLVDPGEVGRALAIITAAGAFVAIVVQPTVGSISDYTRTRWGRRKPYIVIGAALDVVFLVGIAASQHYLAILAFFLLLQFSSNFAQGPFQGYVPDLVPARQVALASALVGVMSVLGPIGGVAIASIGLFSSPPDFTLPTIALGVIELTTGLVTVLTVDEGRRAKDRAGRSWLSVALETWGLDVLRERSFVWLVASRLFVLAGISMLLKIVVYYLGRSLGLSDAEQGFWITATSLVLAAAIVVSSIPSAYLSDRLGRKTLIYAACAVGALGMAVVAVAPGIAVAIVGALLVGIAAGTFLAVDWALMSDIIPKASSGRYMGISNVATGLAGTVAVAVGGTLIDLVDGATQGGAGPRIAYATAIGFFALGALLLRPVDPRRREDEPAGDLTPESAGPPPVPAPPAMGAR